MSTPQAIDHKTLEALLETHILAFGRSFRDTDRYLAESIIGAVGSSSCMAYNAIECFEDRSLLLDLPERSGIEWHLFSHGFDLAIELTALVSESPLSPNLARLEEIVDEARALILKVIESAISDHNMPARSETKRGGHE